MGKRFRVAFSFAGEKRAFVAETARILADQFGQELILYDKYHQSELARPDLAFYLLKLYGEQTDLVVGVFCNNYKAKEWCGLEWRAIYGLLKLKADHAVMLSRFGHVEPEGLSSLAGFIDLDEKTPEQLANLIRERLAMNEGRHRSFYIPRIDPPIDLWSASATQTIANGGESVHRFYISSPYQGLGKEREEAKKLITRRNHAYGDSYGGSPDPLVESCQRDVRASHHYVLILGERYGTRLPEHANKSVAELEFEAAVDAGLSLHAFFLGYCLDARNGIERDPEALAALKAFRRRVSDHCVPVECSDQEDGRSGWQVFTESIIALAANPPQLPKKTSQAPSGEWISAELIKLIPEEVREKLLDLIHNTSTNAEHNHAEYQKERSQGLTPAAEILCRNFEEIENRALGLALAGIPVNFYDLDAMTLGFQRGDLIVLAARPSMGKTSFALNIARNVAQLHKLPVCIFSLEMGKEQLTCRLLSMEVGIESGRLRTGRLHQEEWPLLGNGISELSKLPLYIEVKPDAGVPEMRALCRRLMAETGKELGLVVIDYLQLMEGGGSDNRVQELSRITRSLKGMARELNVPVMALSQLSRGVESRTNKRPMLSDLRESGSIEQDADLVMMIYRDEYYNPETPDRGITEVIITKHRSGPVGMCKLQFEPKISRFRNLPSEATQTGRQVILLASDKTFRPVIKETADTTYGPYHDGRRISPSESVPVYSFNLSGIVKASGTKLEKIRVEYSWRYYSQTCYKPAMVSFEIACLVPVGHKILKKEIHSRPILKHWLTSTVDIDTSVADQLGGLRIYIPCPGDFSFELRDLKVYGIPVCP